MNTKKTEVNAEIDSEVARVTESALISPESYKDNYCNIKRDYKVATLEDVAKMRFELGEHSNISQTFCYVSNACVYFPDGSMHWTDVSPLLNNIDTNAKICESLGYHPLIKSQIDSLKLIKLPNEIPIDIPAKRLGSNDFAVTVFGSSETARKYGELILDAGCEDIRIGLGPYDDWDRRYIKPFAKQILFHSIHNGWCTNGGFSAEDFIGSNSQAFHKNPLRIIREKSTSKIKDSKNFFDANEVKKYLSTLVAVRNGRSASQELKSVEEFLGSLSTIKKAKDS